MLAVALAICVGTSGAGCGGNPKWAGVGKPSLILIVVDTLRADYLASYGFDGPISPHLDRLAEEAVLFEQCSSQAPWTTPSVASMMTSLYPEAHGVRLAPGDPRDQRSWRKRWTRAIPESTLTLAEALRARGYQTAAFVANPFIAKGLGFEQGFETFNQDAAIKGVRDSAGLLDAGLRWFQSLEDPDDPTFVYLHLMDVHGPYVAPEVDFEIVRDAPGLGPAVTLNRIGFGRIQPYLLRPRWASRRDNHELRVWRGRYAAGVHAADRRLGAFFHRLRKSGLWDRQMVVVTSDHGEELFDHGGWDHGFSLHEHQLHVPLLIRLPQGDFGGTRVRSLVRLVDLMPTLAALVGHSGSDEMIGRDLLPLITRGEEPTVPRFAFATSVKEHPAVRSISDGRFKLIIDPATDRVRLYDLPTDPGENSDIAAERPQLVEVLRARLLEEDARVISGASQADTEVELSDQQIERLRELGYLQ
jgi:arylsulfatase A-like enzyme